ncbi:MAG: UDP-N-acetylmuramoyl-L-alanine--D-glutamate ligase [Deltaproteobacteria bacterium]|nr:UDP-N-acetylmuramoyl-L-alanine--D-glutamate ligase [Deltaproteobacteria bacterium]MBW2050675.1 UDP-N-acetylmuramoyl-L-alanine--D-glutamate ligase [Deltaproteobacteria bacterium]MBW2139593.1 UDP-N-acetylmuramoyl-L-alanine--D-glutamate ligase [Deltaproteobacteria bacterium]
MIGRRVVVVGLARTGLAVAEFLLNHGAEVVCTDVLPAEKLDNQIEELAKKGAILELGGHRNETFTKADLIVVSPGVPPAITPLQKAMVKGVPVIGELEYAARYVTVPLIAVTGTNGKSTTTTLIGEILKAAGRKTFVGGNLGNPLINLVNSEEAVDLAVVEVSSFQLESVESFHPQIAIHLNLTPDHLDRYDDFNAYAEAKARIFSRQGPDDTAVLNTDDGNVAEIKTQARRLMFSRKKKIEDGAFIEDGKVFLAQQGRTIGVLALEETRLKGSHNQENIMAALLAAWAAGIDMETAFKAAADFKGLPHRIEFAGEYKHVRYYNDSKATNVGAVIKSLESFEEPVILIAGGRDKDGDFNLLRPAVEGKVKLLILMGEAREKMAKALEGAVETVLVKNMAEAVALAGRKAGPGEAVLLAPACASFDMFKDYTHRGRVFTQLVQSGSE